MDDSEPLVPIQGAFTDIGKAERQSPVWVIENVLPTGLVLLNGPEKDAYKTTLLLGFAALVAKWPCAAFPADWVAKCHGPSMLFLYEDSAGEARYIVEKGMGVKTQPDESILIADEPDTWRLDDEDALDQMFYWLNERKPVLVGLDPFINFHSIDEKDAGPMIRLISPLRRWAKQNGAVFIICHHPRKQLESGHDYSDLAKSHFRLQSRKPCRGRLTQPEPPVKRVTTKSVSPYCGAGH